VTVTVEGPPLGTLYLRPVAAYGQRAPGKTPAHAFDAAGQVQIEVEPDRPYRVVMYTEDRTLWTIEQRTWA
jgi:hypothetical protein